MSGSTSSMEQSSIAGSHCSVEFKSPNGLPYVRRKNILNNFIVRYFNHLGFWGFGVLDFCQDGRFRGQISVLNNVTWTWSCMNIVYSGPLMHIASF